MWGVGQLSGHQLTPSTAQSWDTKIRKWSRAPSINAMAMVMVNLCKKGADKTTSVSVSVLLYTIRILTGGCTPPCPHTLSPSPLVSTMSQCPNTIAGVCLLGPIYQSAGQGRGRGGRGSCVTPPSHTSYCSSRVTDTARCGDQARAGAEVWGWWVSVLGP